MKTKNYLVYDIEYDEADGVDLPGELTIKVPLEIIEHGTDEIEDYLSDKISNKTGFCHNGFNYKRS